MMPGDDSLVFQKLGWPWGARKTCFDRANLTQKQCKCQYVQEQGVIFSRWIFSPQLGKTQQCMGNKIFFFLPQNTIVPERLSVCVLTERKKEWHRFIWEENQVCPSLFLSVLEWHWTRWVVQWLLSYWSWDLSNVLPLYSVPFPHLSVWSMISLHSVLHRKASVLVAAAYTTVL